MRGGKKKEAMYLGAHVIDGKKQNAFYRFSDDRKTLRLIKHREKKQNIKDVDTKPAATN